LVLILWRSSRSWRSRSRSNNACGSALDDTQALAALEAYRVFGRIKAAGDEPDWRAIRAASMDVLADSKDLRVWRISRRLRYGMTLFPMRCA